MMRRMMSKRNIKEVYKIEFLELFGEAGEGSDFGELALINSKPRAATIRAEEDWKLAVLNKKEFSEILQKHMERKRNQEIDQLNMFELFKGFSRVFKSKLLKSMIYINVSRGMNFSFKYYFRKYFVQGKRWCVRIDRENYQITYLNIIFKIDKREIKNFQFW